MGWINIDEKTAKLIDILEERGEDVQSTIEEAIREWLEREFMDIAERNKHEVTE